MIFVIISIELQERNNIRYFRSTCKSDALRVVHKSEGAVGGPLCTRDFPQSEGAVVISEGARHTLASV